MMSCLKYADMHQPFIKLMDRFWPNHPPVAMITDIADVSTCEGYGDIFTYGPDSWCEGLSKFTIHLDDEATLIFLDDFWINAPVNVDLIDRGLEQMEKTVAGCVRLYPCPGPDEEYGDPHFGIVSHGARYRVSTQAALWRPSYLRQIAEQYKTPWEFELDGSAFSDSLPEPVLAFRRDLQPWPVSYYGAVRHGQWAPAVKPFMESVGIDVDWNRRGFQAA